jgi:opacity protein-like surface antigen
MAKKTIPALWVVAALVAASPPPCAAVEVALFYAPNLALGGLNGLGEAGPLGVKARVAVAESGALRFNAGVGYGLYRYRSKHIYYLIWDRVGEIPAWTFSFGTDVVLDRGRWRPYGAFGFAAALEPVDLRHEKRTDFTPGIYVGGGTSFGLGDRWAVALEPRYTYYFDKAVALHDLGRMVTGVQTDGRFQCAEVLIGVTYGF